MFRTGFVSLSLVLGTLSLSACATATAPAASSASATSDNLYADTDKWLCLPGREDHCSQDLTTTIVAADGTTTVEPFKAAANPPVDCFYVYPTVSFDKTGNSDWQSNDEEHRVILQQTARFQEVCKVYAPIYRQVTMSALGRGAELAPAADRLQYLKNAFADVNDAWRYYMDHYNQGRGVILIGHSQGSRMLNSLISMKIEGSSDQDHIVAAYLNGTSVEVPEGERVGGSFKSMPLCASATETGCVVAYRSFRRTLPPVNDYAATETPDMQIACVNPAALSGGRGWLKPYLSTSAIAGGPTPDWAEGKTVTTPFATVPGLLSAECVSDPSGQYLAIDIHADPSDPRTDDITGDIYTAGKVNPAMGLHLIDVNLTMGNLLDLARSQSAAYLAK